MNPETTLYETLQNRGLAAGQLVVATAGHDAGRVYLVIEVNGSFVLCIDGAIRPVDKPKRKRWRHVRPLGQLRPGWALDLEAQKDIGQKNALVRMLIENHAGWTTTQPAD